MLTVGEKLRSICDVRNVREKRDLMDHYSDDHCLDHFSVESNTIIRTKDSQENGAIFLNDTEVVDKLINIVVEENQ